MNDKKINDAVNISSSSHNVGEMVGKYSKIRTRQAHGFVAEEANNKIDRLLLRKSEVIGGDNLRNGADRVVNEINLQTKYCQNANTTMNNALDHQGIYRYYNTDGTPMILEVPKDQYNEVLEIMKKKITEGKVKGITNPEEASSLVRRGYYNYDTCLKMAKAGTIEGLWYDAQNAIVSSAFAGGISAVISFAFNMITTKDKDKSLKEAVKMGGKTLSISFTSSIISAQLLRTNIVGKLVAKIGPTYFGSMVASGVILGFQTVSDIRRVFKNEISLETLVRNLGKNSTALTGGAIGAGIGKKMFGGFGAILGGIGGAIAGAIIGDKLFGYNQKDIEKKLNTLYMDLQNEIDKYDEIETSFININKIKEIIECEEGIRELMNNYYGFLNRICNLIEEQVKNGSITVNKKINLIEYQDEYFAYEEKYLEEFKKKMNEKIEEIENRVNDLTNYHIAKLDF